MKQAMPVCRVSHWFGRPIMHIHNHLTLRAHSRIGFMLIAGVLLAISPIFADIVAQAPARGDETATVDMIQIDPAAAAVLDRAVAFYGEVEGLEIETAGETYSAKEKSSETADLRGEATETLRFQYPGNVYFNRRGVQADSDIEYVKNAASSMVLYNRQSYESILPSKDTFVGQGLSSYGSDTGFVLVMALQGVKWREFVASTAQQMGATLVRIEGGSSTDHGETLSRVTMNFEVPGSVALPDEQKFSDKRRTLRRIMLFDKNGALVSVMSVDRVEDKDVYIKETEIVKHEVNPKFAPGSFEIQLPPNAKPLNAKPLGVEPLNAEPLNAEPQP